MSSPQLNWEEWESREPDDPMKTCHPNRPEQHNPSGENLEAWRYIAGEFGKLDARETKACKEDMDTLIVVAGLFSAVFATFNVEFYKQLQPSSEGMSVYLLAKIAHHLNETLVTPDIVEGLRPPSQPSSPSTPVVNAFWFSGLVLSLMTAAGAMSIKQWLRDYSATTVHLPHHYCRLRFFRRSAFSSYKVYEIAASLPYVLQCALTLFLIGLACFLWELNTFVFGAVLIPLVVWLALYAAMIIISLMDPACPYTFPVIGKLYHFVHRPLLRAKLFVYRQLGRRYEDYSLFSPHIYYDNDHIARKVPGYDALVLVSAYSTFQTKDMNEQVMKAFRTVHLGKINCTTFLRYLFTPSNKVQVSAQIHWLLQPAVMVMLAGIFPSMSELQDIGVDRYLRAVKFAFSSANVGRARMNNVLGNICALQDEHLSSDLVEHVWDAVSPCFDFHKKNRWTMDATSARVLDVFTKFLSLHLSNDPHKRQKFGTAIYGNDRSVNWIGFYLFLLVHTDRDLDAVSLDKAHSILIQLSDLLQYVVNRYKDKFTQEPVTRAQLCIELAEEFQTKYSTAIDPALLTGLKHIASIDKPYVPRDTEIPFYLRRIQWQEPERKTALPSNHTSDQTMQQGKSVVALADSRKEGVDLTQPSTGPQSSHPSTLPVNDKQD